MTTDPTPGAVPARLRARWAAASAAVGVTGLFAAVAIAAAGGGIARLRFVSIGVQSPWPALGVGVVCSLAGWWASRAATPSDPPLQRPRTTRAVRLGACAVALGAALVAWAYGTESAAGADASGYLNAARLFASGSTSIEVPLAADAPWPDALRTMAPLGFRPGANASADRRAPGTLVPTYAPGLPLVLAAAMRIAPRAWPLVVPAFAALAVLATFVVATRVTSSRAALLAASGIASSPVFLFHAIQPMSDVPTTAWWMLALACALQRSAGWSAAAGLCTSAAILTRPNLAPLALVVLAVAMLVRRAMPTVADGAAPPGGESRAATDRPSLIAAAVAYAAAVLPGVAAVGWFNTRLYGHPLVSGYGAAGELFSLSSVPVNVARYAAWLFEIHPVASLLTAASAVLFASRWRASGGGAAEASAGTRPIRIALAAFVALVVGAYLVYAPFENWTYLRFLLPAFPLAAIAASSLLDDGLTRVCAIAPAIAGRAAQATVWAVVCGLVVGLGIRESAARGVFGQRAIDARHELIAAAYAPRAASTVFVTQQHGGAVRFHLGAIVVRWDLVDPAALDGALTWLTARGLSPVILLDADEEPVFRQRFDGRGSWARLDWPARFETLPPQRARAWEPADRARFEAGESWRPDALRAGTR